MRLELEAALLTPHARRWVALGVISFVSNWAWEMAQMRAYATLADQPWSSTILPCTVAAVGDSGVTLAIAAVAVVLTKLLRLPVVLLCASLSALVAVLIEKVQLARGAWSYSEDMPIVPLIGVGLLPLLQLTLLVPASIILAQWWIRRRTRQPG